MILSQFAEVALPPEPQARAHTQKSRALAWGGKMAQKGGFAETESFAIVSSTLTILKEHLSKIEIQVF